MILYSLRTKVMALVSGGLLLATVCIAFLAHNGMERMIDRSQTAVYQDKLDHLLITLTQYHDELEKTLQVDVYRDQFQEEALRIIRQNYLADADENFYPFILDSNAQVMLHPVLSFGDKSVAELDFVQTMLNTPAGNFKYRYLEEDKWLVYARFEPWDWVVAYSLKQSYMYTDLTRFHQTLMPVLIAVLLIVAVVLLYGLQRFLRPILRLTKSAGTIADGDLEQPIEITGRDEVADLSRNFESMRTAVYQTITNLDRQRTELEKEVVERQRAESHAHSAEERLRVILSSVADILLVTDLNHQVLMFNPAAQISFPNIDNMMRLREALNDATLEEAIEPIVCKNVNQIQVEWSQPRVGDASQIFNASSAAIFELDNKLVGVVTLLHDVTKAKELDRLKSEFLSTAAHELRTPLAVIQGFSELMNSDPRISLNDRKEYLGIILHRCQYLESLIEDLLDVSRIETGQGMKLILDEFDLNSLVEQMVTHFQNGSTNHQFVVHSAAAPLNVSADSSKILRVLENLLSNAAKFSPAKSQIDITCEERDGIAWVLVKDQGIGIHPDKQNRIFEKFYRVDGSDTAPQGLGLGLHIVNSIATVHGGQISLDSNPGKGTTIGFGLPITARVD